jgi:hypothetical protein
MTMGLGMDRLTEIVVGDGTAGVIRGEVRVSRIFRPQVPTFRRLRRIWRMQDDCRGTISGLSKSQVAFSSLSIRTYDNVDEKNSDSDTELLTCHAVFSNEDGGGGSREQDEGIER